MELSGHHFQYAGISSRDKDLIFANADTIRLLILSGESESIKIYNRRENKNHIVGHNHRESPVEFEAEIVKCDLSPISYQEQREIQLWLFNQSSYCKLYVDPQDDIENLTTETVYGSQKRLYLNCRIIKPEKMEYNGGVVGYKVVVQCDSNMAWQDASSTKIDVNNTTSSSSKIISITCSSDFRDYIYPRVNIVVGDIGGDITISNNTDMASRLTRFKQLSPSASIIIDGKLNYVSGDYYSKFSGQNFIRLLPGDNKLTVSGNVKSIEFIWQNRRYL